MSIPTPPDLMEGRVSWTIGRGSSRALAAGRGVVRFTASAFAVNFSTASVLPEPVETPVLAGVMTPVDLIQNDPELWNWVVEPVLGVPWEPFPIDVDGPVDLATAAVTPGKGPIRAVKGETGPGLTGQVRYEDGDVEFEIEDGTWTDPVAMPPGPPGPSNRLRIGSVTTSAAGAAAAASTSGESPDQFLNLVLPRGEKPQVSWQGSTIVVDGTAGPDLRGPASTVPGPANSLSIGTVTTGAAGSAAAAQINGTAPNQALGLTIPRGDQGARGPAGNVKIERPAPGVWDFQPEELDVQIADVQGLAARLAALEYTSEPRDITARFSEITAGSVITSRSGRMVTTTFYGVRIGGWPSGATFVHLAASMPDGFRPQRGHLPMPMAEGGVPAGRVRIVGGSGQVTFYNGTAGMLFYATLTYPTPDLAPVVPPGSAV